MKRKRQKILDRLFKEVKALTKNAKAELRYLDTAVFAKTSVNTTASLTLLNGVERGNDTDNRESDNIFNRMLSLRFSLFGDTGGARATVRVTVLYDRQTNEDIPGDIFQTSTEPLSMRNWNSRKRFVFLYDETFSLQDQTTVTRSIVRKVNRYTRFNISSSGSVDNILSGSIYLVVLSSETVSLPSISWCSRVSFMP